MSWSLLNATASWCLGICCKVLAQCAKTRQLLCERKPIRYDPRQRESPNAYRFTCCKPIHLMFHSHMQIQTNVTVDKLMQDKNQEMNENN